MMSDRAVRSDALRRRRGRRKDGWGLLVAFQRPESKASPNSTTGVVTVVTRRKKKKKSRSKSRSRGAVQGEPTCALSAALCGAIGVRRSAASVWYGGGNVKVSGRSGVSRASTLRSRTRRDRSPRRQVFISSTQPANFDSTGLVVAVSASLVLKRKSPKNDLRLSLQVERRSPQLFWSWRVEVALVRFRREKRMISETGVHHLYIHALCSPNHGQERPRVFSFRGSLPGCLTCLVAIVQEAV